MPKLFSELKIRDLTLKNRIIMSPMCQYSALNAVATDWHMAHIGARATGGVGLILMEATGVNPAGRITPLCLGLWNEEQAHKLASIVKFCHSQNAKIGIQLAHAGRKASCDIPWRGGKPLEKNDPNYWPVVGPSELAFNEEYQTPHALTKNEIDELVNDFARSALLADKAQFDVIEIHAAHGYLLHQFLSPLSNKRADEFGGSLENRMRFPLMVAKKLREIWPQHKPLFVRISATDWAEGGWGIQDSVIFCKELKKIGVDFIDVSTGGNISGVRIPTGPSYQVEFAKRIKDEANILTGAVGLITSADQAESILQEQSADAILFGRELLRNPYFALEAAKELQVEISVPPQYQRM